MTQKQISHPEGLPTALPATARATSRTSGERAPGGATWSNAAAGRPARRRMPMQRWLSGVGSTGRPGARVLRRSRPATLCSSS